MAWSGAATRSAASGNRRSTIEPRIWLVGNVPGSVGKRYETAGYSAISMSDRPLIAGRLSALPVLIETDLDRFRCRVCLQPKAPGAIRELDLNDQVDAGVDEAKDPIAAATETVADLAGRGHTAVRQGVDTIHHTVAETSKQVAT